MVAAAVIGAVATTVGTVATVSATNKASKTVSKAAESNNALQTDIYNQNKATLAPFVRSGTSATRAIEALLGLGGGASTTAPAWSFGGVDYYPDGQGGFTTQAPQAGGNAAAAQEKAFETWRNSTGYQFQKQEGEKAVRAALGAGGNLDSGAAVKSALKYSQGLADSSFGGYLGALQNQQGIGLTAASAQAGVGQGYANAVGANTTAAANTAANATLSNAANINQALGSATGALVMNQALKSSYGGGGFGDPWTRGVGI